MKKQKRKVFPRVWNQLDESTWRLEVFGGWVLFSSFPDSDNPSDCMCFIPDREHEWKVVTKPSYKEEINDNNNTH